MKALKEEQAEKEIKRSVVISRDRAVQRQEFTELFSDKHYDEKDLSPQTMQIWDRLHLIVSIIRKKPGASMEELVSSTKLTPREIRQAIRLIITLGGDVEVKCLDWQCVSEGRFFLHN